MSLSNWRNPDADLESFLRVRETLNRQEERETAAAVAKWLTPVKREGWWPRLRYRVLRAVAR